MNHYETLGISTTASYEDIKRAWRLRAKECHPDKYQNQQMKKDAHDRFVKLGEAYTVLIDESKRRTYDQLLVQSQKISIPAPNYSEYQNANLNDDLAEIEKIRKEVFAESGAEFAKNTFGSALGLYFCGGMTIAGLMFGNIIAAIVFLIPTVFLAMEMYTRAERLKNWNKNNNQSNRTSSK